MIKIQAAGAKESRGRLWDWKEDGDIDISQVFISHDGNYIKSIQFEGVREGNYVLSPSHGNHGPIFLCVKFDQPEEYLKKLSGKYDAQYGSGIVSLTLTTNKKSYGPIGNSREHRMVDLDEYMTDLNGDEPVDYRYPEFDFDVGENRFGGFNGSVGSEALLSIGIYVNLIAGRRRGSNFPVQVQGNNNNNITENENPETIKLEAS